MTRRNVLPKTIIIPEVGDGNGNYNKFLFELVRINARFVLRQRCSARRPARCILEMNKSLDWVVRFIGFYVYRLENKTEITKEIKTTRRTDCRPKKLQSISSVLSFAQNTIRKEFQYCIILERFLPVTYAQREQIHRNNPERVMYRINNDCVLTRAIHMAMKKNFVY